MSLNRTAISGHRVVARGQWQPDITKLVLSFRFSRRLTLWSTHCGNHMLIRAHPFDTLETGLGRPGEPTIVNIIINNIFINNITIVNIIINNIIIDIALPDIVIHRPSQRGVERDRKRELGLVCWRTLADVQKRTKGCLRE